AELDHLEHQINSSSNNYPYFQFQSAYTQLSNTKPYPTYTALDRLLPYPFLLSSSLTVIHTTDKLGKSFLTQELFIKLILKYYTQGIVFIDCTNVFPAYELIEATIDMNSLLDPQLPIRSVQLSRSFNYHQATEVITEHLEPLVRDGFPINLDDKNEDYTVNIKPKFVILAGLSDLYLNQESSQYLGYDGRPEWFSIFELQHALGFLKSLAIKYSLIPIITTSTAPLSNTKPLGGSFLTHSSSQLIKISSEGNGLYGELVKHPFAKSKRVLLQLLRMKDKKYISRRLASYLR
ncbi:MAG: hypothetical protein ACC656_07210, partial [Candidatus Heimdallarchaeota archaeon]